MAQIMYAHAFNLGGFADSYPVYGQLLQVLPWFAAWKEECALLRDCHLVENGKGGSTQRGMFGALLLGVMAGFGPKALGKVELIPR